MFAENLGEFFDTSDFAVAATFGSETAEVILDAPDEDILGAEVRTREYRITYRATQLTSLTAGSTITVAGNSYKVRELRAIEDGALMRATLTRV